MKHKLWLVFAVILALGVTAHFVVRSAEDRVTDRMLSGAGRFAIPSEWKLTRETVRPERFMCISTNPCPSLHRRWETGKELTDSDIAALMSGLGFDMTTDHPCKRDARVIGVGMICMSTGTDSEFRYWLSVTSSAPREPQLVTLNVRPQHLPDQLLLSLGLSPIFELSGGDAFRRCAGRASVM